MSRNQLKIDKVRSAVLDNRRITIREFSDDVRFSSGSVRSSVTEDLGMKLVSAKFVRKLPTVEPNLFQNLLANIRSRKCRSPPVHRTLFRLTFFPSQI